MLHTPPYEPLDVLLSYSHLNLQNATFAAFAPALRDRARVKQLLTASPLNMGLLTSTPPAWIPAPKALRDAVRAAEEAVAADENGEGGIVDVALGYAYRVAREADLPSVVGLSRPREVHETMRVWRELQKEDDAAAARRLAREERALGALSEFAGYSWASP